ncbi:cation transporting ATPase C-terminal domain-containing protein [Geodermatophilus sp. SYSU D00758]
MSRPAWRVPWRGNRLLVGAVAVELVVLAVLLLVPPVADLLGMAPPPLPGRLLAAAAVPLVLLADGAAKALTHRRPR